MTPPAESAATPATATENDLATNVARYFCAERMLLHETPSGERLPEQSEPESSPAVATEPHVPRILLAEDDAEMRSLLTITLRRDGYEVVECADGIDLMERVVALLAKHKPHDIDLIISDIRMPWATGLQVLQGMRQYVGFPPMILITAFGDEETHNQARELGAAALLDKPFEMNELMGHVHSALPRGPWLETRGDGDTPEAAS